MVQQQLYKFSYSFLMVTVNYYDRAECHIYLAVIDEIIVFD